MCNYAETKCYTHPEAYLLFRQFDSIRFDSTKSKEEKKEYQVNLLQSIEVERTNQIKRVIMECGNVYDKQSKMPPQWNCPILNELDKLKHSIDLFADLAKHEKRNQSLANHIALLCIVGEGRGLFNASYFNDKVKSYPIRSDPIRRMWISETMKLLCNRETTSIKLSNFE